MTPGTTEREVDVIVIGAGAVGENAAERAVRGGLTCVIVEAELVGGECSYWACMPSKALLRPGAALHGAQSVAGSEEAVTGTLDAPAVLKRRDGFTSHWKDDSQVEWLRDTGIDLLRGRARITSPRQVAVTGPDGEDRLLRARHAVVLATGSHPSVPAIDGLAGLEFWGTREATSAKTVPRSLAVLGGGVAGVELAQAFARLGAHVTLVARGALLGSYPREASRLVASGLRADGVELRLHTATERVEQNQNGEFTLTLAGGAEVTAERLLVSTGRHPALGGLGLETLGFKHDDGTPLTLETSYSGAVQGIRAEDTGRSGQPWLYAIGDAAGKVLLTHQGKYEARATGEAIVARARGTLPDEPAEWSKQAQSANRHAVPQIVFTDPEIASVGRNREQARADGFYTSTVELPIAVAGSSLHSDSYEGWAQLVIDEDRKVLLGATFAGPDVAELLHAATIAVVGEVPLDRLWHAVPSYPTISEVWLRLLEKYGL